MAHLDDLIIRIKAILDSGGFDQAANKVKDVGDTANRASNDLAKMGNDGRSSFMQLQYGANSSLSSVNKNLQSVDTNSTGLWSNIKQGASSAWSSIKQGASSAASSIANNFSAAKSHASDLFNSMSGLEGMATGAVGAIAGAQVYDLIVGTSAKAETNKVLLGNMTQTQKGADSLFKTVDNATNKTLVSMQQVIPALNAFKAATAANEQQLNATAPGVAQFGSFVYAMTGSAAKAETAMFDLSKGIKGAYASLDQYGITEDALMRTGLWSGKTDDVEGYIAAVNAVTGSTDELMGTFTGLQATVGKIFSIGAKKLGATILPILKNILQDFISLNDRLGGNLAPTILAVAGALSILAVGLGIISAIMPAATALWGIFTSLIGLNSAATTANTATRIGNIAATTANTGSLAGNTASFTANTAATVTNTTATSANNAASAGASAAGLGLSATLGIVAVAAIALAVAFIYLKTQTNLLDGASDRASKSMKGLNHTMDILSKQQEASSEKVKQLEEKLNTLSKGSYEYEVTWKNYEDEKNKIETMKKKIAEIQGKKDYIASTVLNSQSTLQRYNDAKNAQGETPITTDMAFDGGRAMMDQVARMNYYNSYLDKSTKKYLKLSDAEKKTFNGQRITKFNDKLAEVADLETKITEDIANGKDPSWLDQATLHNAKKELEEMAGIKPGDNLETKGQKLDALASGNTNYIDGTKTKEGIDKWFADASSWINNGFNTLKQLMLNKAADMTKDIPIIGDFFENLKGNKGDIGAAIVKTIQDIDWAGLGSDVGGKLIEGIKGKLETMPIIGDIMRLLEGGSSSLSTGGENSNTSGNGFSIPQLNWGNFISSWGIGDWAGKITQWSSWASKITNWSNWSSKITQWSNWASKITAVNLANYVLGAFGAGGDDIGAGGDDIETSSVSSSSVTTRNNYIKKNKSSSKKINVVNHNTFNLKGDEDVVQKIVDELFKQVEARG